MMKRRNFLKTIGLGAAAFAGSGPLFLKDLFEKDRQLNFVFLLVDDMGWADLGIYGSRFYTFYQCLRS